MVGFNGGQPIERFMKRLNSAPQYKMFKRRFKRSNGDNLHGNEIRSFQHRFLEEGLYKGLIQTLDAILSPFNHQTLREREREAELFCLWKLICV